MADYGRPHRGPVTVARQSRRRLEKYCRMHADGNQTRAGEAFEYLYNLHLIKVRLRRL